MSKCREAFEEHFAGFDLTREKLGNELAPFYYKFQTQEVFEDWQAAWNAATQNAVEICIKQRADTNDEDAVGWNTACTECAEAIEREIEK